MCTKREAERAARNEVRLSPTRTPRANSRGGLITGVGCLGPPSGTLEREGGPQLTKEPTDVQTERQRKPLWKMVPSHCGPYTFQVTILKEQIFIAGRVYSLISQKNTNIWDEKGVHRACAACGTSLSDRSEVSPHRVAPSDSAPAHPVPWGTQFGKP